MSLHIIPWSTVRAAQHQCQHHPGLSNWTCRLRCHSCRSNNCSMHKCNDVKPTPTTLPGKMRSRMPVPSRFLALTSATIFPSRSALSSWHLRARTLYALPAVVLHSSSTEQSSSRDRHGLTRRRINLLLDLPAFEELCATANEQLFRKTTTNIH